MRYGAYAAFYVLSGVAGSVGAAACEDWPAAIRFQIVTLLAWSLRVWAYRSTPSLGPLKALKKYQILGTIRFFPMPDATRFKGDAGY